MSPHCPRINELTLHGRRGRYCCYHTCQQFTLKQSHYSDKTIGLPSRMAPASFLTGKSVFVSQSFSIVFLSSSQHHGHTTVFV